MTLRVETEVTPPTVELEPEVQVGLAYTAEDPNIVQDQGKPRCICLF